MKKYLSFGNKSTASYRFLRNVLMVVSAVFLTVPLQGQTNDFDATAGAVQHPTHPFTISIAGADVGGDPINGENLVTVTSITGDSYAGEGEVFSQLVSFTDGATSLSLTLQLEGEHRLKVEVADVSNPDTLTISVEDYSQFSASLPGSAYAEFAFDLTITGALDVTGAIIRDTRHVRVTSSQEPGEGVVFEGAVGFSASGGATIPLSLVQSDVDPGLTHNLAISIEGVTQEKLQSIKIIDNPSSFTVMFLDDEPNTLTIYAGGSFYLSMYSVIKEDGNLLDGSYEVEVTSNLQDESLIKTVSFIDGSGTIDLNDSFAKTIFIAGLHTLTVDIPALNHAEERPGLTVNTELATHLKITQQPNDVVSGQHNGADVAIGEVKVKTADEYGNEIPRNDEILVELIPVDSIETTAQLKGTGTNGISGISINTTDMTEAIFSDLTLNANGLFRLRFYDKNNAKEVLSNIINLTNMEDVSGFTIVDPGPQLQDVPFFMELENVQTYNGTLLNKDTILQVVNSTDGVVYDAVTVTFTQGMGIVPVTISEAAGTKNILVTVNGIGLNGENVAETQQVNVVAVNQSAFAITDPGAQVAGRVFTLALSSAVDVAGDTLSGEHQVVVNAADEGELFSGSATFSAGATTIEGLVLNNTGDQMVTVNIDWVTNPDSISLSVNPGIRITDSNGNTMGPDEANFVFPGLVEGYSQEDANAIAETFTVNLIGTETINNLNIAAPTGYTAGTLSATTLDTITTSATFTLTPVTGHSSPGLMDSLVLVNYEFGDAESETLTYSVDFPVESVPLTFDIIVGKYAEPIEEIADYDELVLTDTTPIDIVLSNTGTGNINNLTSYLSGANVNAFELSQPVSVNLEVEEMTSFNFNPIDGLNPGTYTANVNVTADNDVYRIFKITYTQVNTGLSVSLDPADSLFLGTFSAGYSSTDATQTITITNTGTTEIASYSIGLNGTDFSVNPASGFAIASGGTATFTVSPATGLSNNTFISDVITVTALDASENSTTATLPVRFLVDQMQWQGGINTNWSQAENWRPLNYFNGEFISLVPATVPNRNVDIIIPNTDRDPVISSLNIPVQSLEIQSGAQLTVSSSGVLTVDAGGSLLIKSDATNSGGHLFVSSQLINNGTLTLESTQSNGGKLTLASSGRLTSTNGTLANAIGNVDNFVVQSTSSTASGSVILNNSGVYGSVQRWMEGPVVLQLVSAPVIGQDIESFVADGANAIAETSSGNIAIRTYDEATDTFSAWTTNFSGWGDFTPGHGYALARATSGPVTFKGELISTSQTFVLKRSGFGWNMLGNPFPSSLGVKDIVNGFLNTNNVNQLDPNYAAVYYYDYSLPYGSRYFPVNNASSGYNYMASGQGFFVKAAFNPSPATLSTDMRAHQNSAIMVKDAEDKKQSGWQRLNLAMTAGSNSAQTVIAFNGYMSSGLDVSYDAGMYVNNPGFLLYSLMPLGESTLKMGIQALPDNNFAQLMVPLGVVNKPGGSVEFKASRLELQPHLSPLLYDKHEDLYTDLILNTYTATITENDAPTGRFFVRMQDSRNLHPVQFSVDGMGGDLYGVTGETVLDNGADYAEGTQMVFTALPWHGYKVYQWMVNGSVLDHTEEELKIRLLGEVNVSVAFTSADKQDDILMDADNVTEGEWQVYYAHGEIVIQGNMPEGSSVNILDINGRSLVSRNLHEGPVNTIAVGALSEGIYFVKVTQTQNVETKRLYIR